MGTSILVPIRLILITMSCLFSTCLLAPTVPVFAAEISPNSANAGQDRRNDLSKMWTHISQSFYSAPESVPKFVDKAILNEIHRNRPTFFTGSPRTLGAFAKSYEFYRALPEPSQIPSLIPNNHADHVVHAYQGELAYCCEGGPPIYVQALLCAKEHTVVVIKEAVHQLLEKSGFEIEFPGWNEVGFLHARRATQGEVFVDATKLFEEIKLAIKLDERLADPIAALSIVYEINAGMRRFDLASWEDKSNTVPALQYVDKLRWKMQNIIQSSFNMFCRTVKSAMSNSTDEALARLHEKLTQQQWELVKGAIKSKTN